MLHNVLYNGSKIDELLESISHIKTVANGKSQTFKALATLCPSIPLEYVVLDEKKDNTELKIISKINETIFAPAFAKYVVNQESEPITEVEAATSGEGYSVKVKFADNRSYEYNCFSEIQVGDIVLVGGAKAGQRGMIVAITGNKTYSGYYNVEKILRYEGNTGLGFEN